MRSIIEDETEHTLEVAPNATSLDLLQAVYRCAALPLPTRMRAAMAALHIEHPKLGVTAIVDAGDLALRSCWNVLSCASASTSYAPKAVGRGKARRCVLGRRPGEPLVFPYK
jgi:hypothetical protein